MWEMAQNYLEDASGIERTIQEAGCKSFTPRC